MNKKLLYTIVVALSVTVLIVSNLASTKLFDFFGTGLVWDGGAIIFPLSYILGDVITEIYGFKQAKRIIITAFAMNLLMVLVLLIVQILPPGPGWENQAAYEATLGFVPRLVAGSLIAYVVGQILNAFTFAKIKIATKGRKLWLRALGSSLAGDLLDTVIFVTIAFLGVISTGQFIGLISIAYVTKIVGEAILLPVTYRVVKFMKKITGSDHYDRRLRFRNLFVK
ncbi:queuosine precursor transporter [Candidatus Saccharibacteria bacterium]|nr:queuosine precursor transporter [Candidatus Saccharibacteria bacterium]